MENKKPQTVVIDGTKYNIEDLSQEQRVLLDHLVDLERKIASVDFQRQQLQGGREYFFSLLKNSLIASKAIAEANAEEPTVQ